MFSVDVLAERIEHRGVRIRDQEHVRLLDLLETADRRTVESETVLEHVLGELVRRNREVLHQSRQVAEPNVDDLDVAVLDELQYVARRALLHALDPLLARVYFPSALHTVSVMRRVTTYGSMLAFGRRSSM